MARKSLTFEVDQSEQFFTALNQATVLQQLFVVPEVYNARDPLKYIIETYYPDATATNIRTRVKTVAQRLGIDDKVIDRVNNEWKRRYSNRKTGKKSKRIMMQHAVRKGEDALYNL